MAISAVSSTVASNQPSNLQLLRQQFAQLVKAVQSGDLAGAQQAYAAIGQTQGGGAGNSNDPFTQALNAIGQALQSGDLTGAQKALVSLQQQMQQAQGARHHHHRHHGGGSPPPAPASSDPASAASGNSVEVTV